MTSVKISYYDYCGDFISEGTYVSQEISFIKLCLEIFEAWEEENKLPCISETEKSIPSFALLETMGRKKIIFLEN